MVLRGDDADPTLPPDPTLTLREVLVEVLHERMDARSMSINALAQAVGMHGATLSRQLRGQGVLTIDEWDAMATHLGAELEELLTEARQLRRHVT